MRIQGLQLATGCIEYRWNMRRGLGNVVSCGTSDLGWLRAMMSFETRIRRVVRYMVRAFLWLWERGLTCWLYRVDTPECFITLACL